jgi:Tol biopolymer transport system component
LAALIAWNLHPEPAKEVRKFQWSSDYSFFELSPDGKKIAYSKADMLWIRFLDKIDPIEIKSNEIISDVFWSPNSDYIAYFTGPGTTEAHELRKVSVNGFGNILIVKTGNNYYPRFWGIDDSILVTTWDNKGGNTLLKVPSSGGELKPICGGDSSLSIINGNLTHILGLPDGRSLLISTNYKDGRNEIILQTEKRRTVLYSNSVETFIDRPAYSGTGHILFSLFTLNSSDIWAIPFNVSSLTVTGNPFLIARNADKPSVSQNGMLLYEDRGITSNGEQLVLLSRSGQILKKLGPSQLDIYSPAVSPDGEKIATASSEVNGEYNIWLYDLTKGTKSQLSYDVPQTWGPTWSPDGKKIAFASGFGENADIYEQEINSSASAKSFIHTEQSEGNPYWSANGQYMLFLKTETKPTRQNDIWYIKMNEGIDPKKLFESKFSEDFLSMSPNGQFVSFMSDKSGQQEVYVTNFPKADKQWQISFNGGVYPQWIGDEIFFMTRRTNELMVVKVKTNPDFQSEVPRKLFSADSAGVMLMNINYLKYTVTRDGKNIIAVKNLTGSARGKIILVENWFEEFKNKNEVK